MKFLRFLDDNAERICLVALLGTMSVVIGFQVIMRYAFQASLSWSEELARYLFIWMIYIGISYGVKLDRHIKVDAFLMLLPVAWRHYVKIGANLLFLGFSAMIIYQAFGVRGMIAELGQESPAIGIPLQWVYTAVPAGFSLVIVRLVQSLIRQIRREV